MDPERVFGANPSFMPVHQGPQMITSSSVDEQSFRKLLSRNIGLPLGVGVLSVVFFVSLITYLMSTIQWVEHTDRVINNANEAVKLTVDLETGMRGYLLTGDEHFSTLTKRPGRGSWWPCEPCRN